MRECLDLRFQTLVPDPSCHERGLRDPLLERTEKVEDYRGSQRTEHRRSEVGDGDSSVPEEEGHTDSGLKGGEYSCGQEYDQELINTDVSELKV